MKAKDDLLRIASEMILAEGLPSSEDVDNLLPQRTSLRVVHGVLSMINQSREMCRRWGVQIANAAQSKEQA